MLTVLEHPPVAQWDVPVEFIILDEDNMSNNVIYFQASGSVALIPTMEKPRNAYVTRRIAPDGYVAVTRPYAEYLYNNGVAVTLCGNNVNWLHVFDGWRLGWTFSQERDDEIAFEQVLKNFYWQLVPEFGSYAVFYVTKENLV